MSYLKEHDDHVAQNGHWSASIVYVESTLGVIQVEQCSECPLMFVRCDHKHNTWNEEGTVLTCDLCGVDGT